MVKVQIKFHQVFIFLVHKKKENFVLVQITHLITIVYLQKRICQPDIKFYLCINILRDIRSKRNIVASVSLIRLEGNVEILQILVVCEEYSIEWRISRQKNIYIYIPS